MEGSIPSLAPCMQEITERYTPSMSMPVNYKHVFDSKQNSSPSRVEAVDDPQLNVPSCNDCTLRDSESWTELQLIPTEHPASEQPLHRLCRDNEPLVLR